MMALAIAAHIGPRSERGLGDGMIFCGYLIPADETATALGFGCAAGSALDHAPDAAG